MDKEQTLFRLRVIVNQIACMSEEEFSDNVFDDTLEMFFENYLFGEKAQVRTHLTMKKISINTGFRK